MVLVFVLIWVKMFYDALSIYSISLDVGSPEPSWQWPGSSGGGGAANKLDSFFRSRRCSKNTKILFRG